MVLAYAILALAQPLPTRVTIAQGTLDGILDPRGMRAFRGIPYAEPPVGQRRWREPQPHAGWKGVLNATSFRSPCMQPWRTTGCYGCGWATVELLDQQSEDCLYANIVSPVNATGAPYAVIVYIHAGEFHFGAATDRESDWPYFADDVVLVSFNYRIGPMGFLAAEELRGRSPSKSTGNYGVLDQRLALQWVRDNIGAFGGDPHRVTLMGESSGGTSVALHLVSPASWGLFQRAILQSPGLTQTKELADAELNTRYVVDALLSVGSPHCARAAGYDAFEGTRLVSRPLPAPGANLSTLALAQAACDARTACVGLSVERLASGDAFLLYSDAKIWDMRTSGEGANFSSYLKASAGGVASVECLLGADAVVLINYTAGQPRDDTFETDNFAPVLDGVEMTKPITQLLAEGRVAPGVDVLLGSNLDEGTIFMSLTPRLSCDASAADLAKWAGAFYGAALAPDILAAYATLEQPVPECHTKSRGRGTPTASRVEATAAESRHDRMRRMAPAPEPPLARSVPPAPAPAPAPAPPYGVNYMAAMRSAGDYTITCRVREAARALARRNHSVHTYFFTHTPIRSLNYKKTERLGAFHGAEVPFAFSFPDELSDAAERTLASHMGCAWRNFAMSGDPNHATTPCKGGQPPVEWPRFRAGLTMRSEPTLKLDLGATSIVHGLKDQQCDAFGLA